MKLINGKFLKNILRKTETCAENICNNEIPSGWFSRKSEQKDEIDPGIFTGDIYIYSLLNEFQGCWRMPNRAGDPGSGPMVNRVPRIE